MNPRDLLIADHRPLFGRSAIAEWKPAESDEAQIVRRAAEIQHEAALALWTAMRSRGERIGELADRRHINAEGLRRKLRGETWANLRDLAMWQLEMDD